MCSATIRTFPVECHVGNYYAVDGTSVLVFAILEYVKDPTMSAELLVGRDSSAVIHVLLRKHTNNFVYCVG